MAAGSLGDDVAVRSRSSSSSSSSSPSCCAVCGKAGATKVCSRCKSVRYCSIECQKRDWTTGGHRRKCGRKQPTTKVVAGPLPPSLRNDRDASSALRELWSIASAEAEAKAAEAVGEGKGGERPSGSAEKTRTIAPSKATTPATGSAPIRPSAATTAAPTTTVASVSLGARDPNPAVVPDEPPTSERPRREPRAEEEETTPACCSPARKRGPPKRRPPPRAATTFVAEEMPQICRFWLALTLSPPPEDLLLLDRGMIEGESSIAVSTEPLGRSRSRTLVTVRLRDRRASAAAANSEDDVATTLFAGEFPRPIEASEITWRVAPRDPCADDATGRTMVVFRLPYPYDPSNTGSLVLGGSLALSCSPTAAATTDEINAVVCGTCHLPLLAAPRATTAAAKRTHRPPIARTFPLPQGHWDEIADYLICYDGQPVVDFAAGSVCSEPSIALQDASLLCLHRKDAEAAVCVLAVDGYGAPLGEPDEEDGKDDGKDDGKAAATANSTPGAFGVGRNMGAFLFNKPSSTCFVLPSNNDEDDGEKNEPEEKKDDDDAATTANVNDNNNSGEPPILPSSAVIRGDRTWQDAADGDSVCLCCARCCSQLGFASLGSPETWRFWKHRLSVPVPTGRLEREAVATTATTDEPPRRPFVPLPMLEPLGSVSSFLARELVRYAESKAIFTFVVRREGCGREDEEEDALAGGDDDRCLLLRLLSWETAVATSMEGDEIASERSSSAVPTRTEPSSSKLRFRKVAKIVFEETVDPTVKPTTANGHGGGNRGGEGGGGTQWFWGGIDLCCPPPASLSSRMTKPTTSCSDPNDGGGGGGDPVSTARLELPRDDYETVRTDLLSGRSLFEEEVAKATILLKMGGRGACEGMGLTAVILE